MGRAKIRIIELKSRAMSWYSGGKGGAVSIKKNIRHAPLLNFWDCNSMCSFFKKYCKYSNKKYECVNVDGNVVNVVSLIKKKIVVYCMENNCVGRAAK